MVLLALSQTAGAGGFYVSTIGTPGSLGTAGAANPTNTFTPDSAWTNPAAMTALKGDSGMVGMQVIIPQNRFDSANLTGPTAATGSDGGNAGLTSVIPSNFIVKSLSDDVRLGFSVVGVMGGGLDYDSDFIGRYSAYRAVLAGVALSPSVAYRVNERFSVGAGVSAVYTTFDQDIAVRQSAIVSGAPDARVSINQIDDWGFTSFYGLTYQLNDKALIGVVYRPEFDANLEGDVNFGGFTVLPTPGADSIKIEWTNPQLLQVGLQYKINDEYLLFVDADWEDWSEFSDNQLAFQGGVVAEIDRNWKDTYHLGIGVVRRSGDQVFSVGIGYDSSPVDDKDRTIDLPLDEQLQFSVAYGRQGEKLDYSIGATLMYLGDGKVDQTAQGVRFKGEFDTNYALFVGGTLRYEF
jgi:long-chain fatty acid transport protein